MPNDGREDSSKIVVEIVAHRRATEIAWRWELDWGGFSVKNIDFAEAFAEIVNSIERSEVNKLGLRIEYRVIELDMRKYAQGIGP